LLRYLFVCGLNLVMSKRLNGILNSLTRDALGVFGTVIMAFGLSNGAMAEPVTDVFFAASKVAVETDTNKSPVSGNSVSAALDAAASQLAGLINFEKKPEEAKIATGGNPREIRCLAEAIYYESRGEPERGQWAVAEVVSNRVKSKAYPNTYCGVAYQSRGNICQFSWACDSRRPSPRGEQWTRAMAMADKVYNGYKPNVVGNALFFHATFVRPSWANVFTRVGKIGTHIFYNGN
jgi:spore germination cell wall hydrolase CwlJ-like protein